MVTHQPKDGHSPEESKLQTQILALRLNSQKYHQVTTAMGSHLIKSWRQKIMLIPDVFLFMPANLSFLFWMCEFFKLKSDFYLQTVIHLPFLGWSPASSWMVTHKKEVNYRLGIWDLHLTHKTKTRWQLPWMVTPTQGWLPTRRMKTAYSKFGT